MKKVRKQEAYVAGLLETKQGVLLIKKSQKSREWHLPSGKIELHETPQVALKRIFWQETGIMVEVDGAHEVITSKILHASDKSTHRITTAFLVHQIGGEAKSDRVAFKPRKSLKENDVSPETATFLFE